MKRIMIVAGFLALLSPSCGGVSALYLRGVNPLNVNPMKEPCSVKVRVYQLKDDSRFNQATVEKIWTDAKGALADDLVAMKQETVFPGAADDEPKKVELGELPGDVRFIGILALFSKEDDKGQRKLVLPRDDAKRVLRLTGYHIEKE
jgi:type VI secretion system VasD/TssJ family lipoprotein